MSSKNVNRNLTPEEIEQAFKDNVEEVKIPYLKRDRRYIDESIPGQTYALTTFCPMPNVEPDANGFFGVEKIRGVFQTVEEAEEYAKKLIYHDSVNKICVVKVGEPFPLTMRSDLTKRVEEVDVRNETTNAISKNIKKMAAEEAKGSKEMAKRARETLNPPKETPIMRYTTLKQKQAIQATQYRSTLKQAEEIRRLCVATRAEIEKMEKKNKTLEKRYIKTWVEGRKKSGIKITEDDAKSELVLAMKNDIDVSRKTWIPEVPEDTDHRVYEAAGPSGKQRSPEITAQN